METGFDTDRCNEQDRDLTRLQSQQEQTGKEVKAIVERTQRLVDGFHEQDTAIAVLAEKIDNLTQSVKKLHHQWALISGTVLTTVVAAIVLFALKGGFILK